MNILNIVDDIYESKYFPTILTIAVLVLIILFIIVLLLGIRDAKKAKEPPKKKVEELKDVTFDLQDEKAKVTETKEDVTFEMPVLTKNLEDFKKN